MSGTVSIPASGGSPAPSDTPAAQPAPDTQAPEPSPVGGLPSGDQGFTPSPLITAPVDNPQLEAPGTAVFPSTLSDVTPFFETTKKVFNFLGNLSAEYGVYDPETHQQLAPPQPTVPVEELNKDLPPGMAPFTSPLPQSVADNMKAQRIEQNQLEEAQMRYPSGFMASAERIGLGFIAQAMDPINVAAAFIPGVGEERVAAALGMSIADDFGSQMVLRGITGAANAFTPNVALAAATYGMDRQAGLDTSAVESLKSVLFGTALGGGLHMAFGPRLAPHLDPETTEAAMRTAISQLAEGRPVEVTPVLWASAAERARNDLALFAKHQERISGEADTLLQDALRTGDEAAAQQQVVDLTGQHLGALQEAHAAIQNEIDQLHAAAGTAIDAATADRLVSIDQEIQQPGLPASRREDLLAERTMLTEGAASTPATDQLEAARSEAQAKGLQIEGVRIQGKMAEATTAHEAAVEAAASAQSQAKQSDFLLGVRSKQMVSRQEVLHAMAERSVRRFAGAVGTELEEGEGATLGRTAIEHPDQVPGILDAIAKRSSTHPNAGGIFAPSNVSVSAATRLDALTPPLEVSEAFDRSMRNLTPGVRPVPEIRKTDPFATEKYVPEAEVKGLMDFFTQAREMMTDEERADLDAELAGIDQELEQIDRYANAVKQAGNCLISKGF